MIISIIIPVYNAAKTIKRCLDNIWSQDLEDDYEVICVNDCSTDETNEVIIKIQESHSNLRLISNNENLRAGGARNHGVRKAKGEYIAFIDADDYYHQGALLKAIKHLKENNLDILIYDMARHPLDKPNNNLVFNFKDSSIMTGRRNLVVNSLPWSPTKYLFRKELMTKNDVWFEEKCSCEDVDWSHKLAFYANRTQYIPLLLYHYILTDISQTAMQFQKKESIFSRMFSGFRVYQLIHLYDREDEQRSLLNVANKELTNGTLFLNTLFISPSEKKKYILKYIPEDDRIGKFLSLVRKFPFLYSILSTAISPIFRLLVIARRKIKGR